MDAGTYWGSEDWSEDWSEDTALPINAHQCQLARLRLPARRHEPGMQLAGQRSL